VEGCYVLGIIEYWNQVRPLIDNGISRLLPIFIERMPTEHAEIFKESIEGGKRVRGTLTCLVAQALGGRLEDALPRAVAIEYIHAATLIHDDYVDLDTVRRNRPAIWTLEGSRRAVLFGDLILSYMINMMTDMSKDDAKAVAEAISAVAMGAFQEPLNPLRLVEDIAHGRFPSGLYDVIIELKTGALFGAAAKLGAIASNRLDLADKVYSYGSKCGEAFQIADDLREVLHIVDTHRVNINKMVTLFPACLYYSNESMRDMLDILLGKRVDMASLILERWVPLIERMSNDIDVRINLALNAIEYFEDNEYTRLLNDAPRHIVRLMLESKVEA